MKPIRVLILHFTGTFGGSSRSLYEVLCELSPNNVCPMFVTQDGSVVDYFSKLGPVIAVKGLTQFDNTLYSYYRRMRWFLVLREIAYLPYTLYALKKAKFNIGNVDIIHVNEFTGIFTLWIAKKFFNAPAVIHVRSVVRNDAKSLRSLLLNYLLRKLGSQIVAIDENVRSSLPQELPVNVIHNIFRVKSQVNTESNSVALSRLSASSFKIGFVGNLLRVKGILEFTRAAVILKNKGYNIEFVVVGDDVRSSRGLKSAILSFFGFQQSCRSVVEDLIEEFNLHDIFHLFGFTSNIGQIYSSLDVLCFPSHYDAPGRPVFEAAIFGVPSIVAVRKPFDDTLIDGITGIAISPHSVDQIVSSIEYLINNPDVTKAMGAAARSLALKNSDVEHNTDKLLSVYKSLINRN
jgi:glycosyltransferase involved in cell wall biosynthesis